MPNVIDKIIAPISPAWAAKRAAHRANFEQMRNAYEATRPGRGRNIPRSHGGPDRSQELAGKAMREQARWFAENHDLVEGVLTSLVNNVVGPNGISVEPQPKTRDGEIAVNFADQLDALYQEWSRRPEVTWEYDRPAMERLAAWSWLRDGEVFSQLLTGEVRNLDHGSQVPLSLELLESDMVPMDFFDFQSNLFEGVRKNDWGRPVSYKVYFGHPGSGRTFDPRTKDVPASRMLHLKMTQRIRQTRGVSVLAPVMTRLNDLKDYEESERVAARIAAAMGMYIKKGNPEAFDANDQNDDDEREFEVAPGMVWDNLRPGEDVGTFGANRPSQLLPEFRNAMLKAVASGTGTNYSTIARDYNGSFSAQRQELVEQFINYSTMTGQFVGMFARPTWDRFVDAAIASGRIRVPRNVDPKTIKDAEFRGPSMPWVDPQKEVAAQEKAVQAGFKSRSQVIRERGGSPRTVDAEIQQERERGPDFTTVPKPDGTFNSGPSIDDIE